MVRMNRRTALIGLGTIVFGTSGFIASGAFDIGSVGSAGQGWVQVEGNTEDVEPDDDGEADVDPAEEDTEDETDGTDETGETDETDTDDETDPTDQDETDTDNEGDGGGDADVEDEELPVFTLAYSLEGEGSISVSADRSAEGSTAGTAIRYTDGTEVTLTAEPDEGYEFVTWTGDTGTALTDESTISVDMDRDRSITAVFEPTEFTLSVQIGGEGAGTVTVGDAEFESGDTFEGIYEDGTEVTLTAEPEGDAAFAEWSGDIDVVSPEEPSLTVTMDRDRTVIATFGELYTLFASVGGEGDGTIDVSGPDSEFGTDPDADGTGTASPEEPLEIHYEPGAEVTLRATTQDDSRLLEWIGDVPTDLPDEPPLEITLTMDRSRTITAIFERTYTLSIGVGGQGIVDVSAREDAESGSVGPSEDWDAVYSAGTEVALNTDSAEEFGFLEWTGDVPGPLVDQEQITIVMDQNRSLTAVFAELLELSVSVEGNGSVSFDGTTTTDSETRTFLPGSVVSLTAVPAEGFEFLEWTGSLGDASRDETSITLEMNRNRSVTAEFAELVELTVTVEGDGSVSFDGTTTTDSETRTFLPDTDVTLTAAPDDGFEFLEWAGNLGSAPRDAVSITLTMDRDRDVIAVFREELLELTRVQVIADPDNDGNLLNTGSLTWSDRMSGSEFVASDDDGLFAGFSVGNANRNAVSRIGIVDDRGYPVDRFAFLIVNAGDPDQPGTGGQPVEIETTIYDVDGNPIGSTDQLTLPYRVTNGSTGTDLLADRVSLDVADVIQVAIEIDARNGTEDVERVATLGFSVRRSD